MFNEKRSSMLHGVLLIALFSCAAFYIGEMSFVRSLSFSPMIVGIILGMLYANSLRNNLPETWVPGIQFCSKKILRIGIILYGFRLTFQDVLAIGLPAMLIDVIIVVVTICGGIYLGKLLKMDRGIALLTSTVMEFVRSLPTKWESIQVLLFMKWLMWWERVTQWETVFRIRQ